MNRRGLILGVAAVFVVIGGAGIYALAPGDAAETRDVIDTPPVAAVFVAGQIDAPEMSARYRGDVRARRSGSLAFRRGGRVASVAVREGDVVAAGETLAALDTADLDAAADAASASLASAAAALDEARRGPRREQIDAARSRLAAAEESLRSTAARLKRERRLIGSGAGSRQTLDDLTFEIRRLSADRDAAEAALEELNNGTRPERIAAAEAGVAAARAELAAIEVRRRDSRIVAMYDAVVSARMIDEGVIVDPSTPVVSVYQRSPMEARFAVPPSVADRLGVDDVVRINVDGSAVTATVARSHPVVDAAARTRTVDVVFDDAERLIPGRSVEMVVPARWTISGADGGSIHPSASVWVPIEALVRGSRGVWSVYVVDGSDTIRRRAVRTGATDGSLAEVSAAFGDGERIVATGTHRLAPGMKVRAVAWER